MQATTEEITTTEEESKYTKSMVERNVFMKTFQFKLPLKSLLPQKKRVNIKNQWLN